MEELQPEDLEELVQELEEDTGAVDPVPRKVRVCPECGKHNLENAWHCIDCGTTLSMKTMMDVEDGQPSVVPIAGQLALSSISPHFEQDVVELLDTTVESDESIVYGCNVTLLARRAPFPFGYLVLTSRRLICVRFEAELQGSTASSATSALLNPLAFMIKEVAAANVRPRRPCLAIGHTGPRSIPALAVKIPGYPLTPEEKASRKVAVHDLGDLISVDLGSLVTELSLMTLTAKFQRSGQMAVTFYLPHEARKTHKLLAAWLE